MGRSRLIVLSTLVVVRLLSPSLSEAEARAELASQYEFIDLGTLGGASSEGYSINNNGQVVGKSLAADGAPHGFFWQDGSMTDIAPGFATDVNDNAVVCGQTGITPYAWYLGTLYPYATLGGAVGIARAINSSNAVVGDSQNSSGERHATAWVNGAPIDLLTLGGTDSVTNDVNDAGAVVGGSDVGDGSAAGFVEGITQSGLTKISYGNGTYTVLNGINNAQDLVGAANVNSSYRHAFYNGTDLTPTLSAESSAQKINDAKQIVGYANTGTGNRAVIWENGSMTDLNSLLPPGSAYTLVTANDINESGSITGTANINGTSHGFVLRPITNGDVTVSLKKSAKKCKSKGKKKTCTVSVGLTVKNGGSGSLPQFLVISFLSANNSLDLRDTFINVTRVNGLAAGASQSIAFTSAYSSGKFIVVKADATNAVNESNKSNNIASKKIN